MVNDDVEDEGQPSLKPRWSSCSSDVPVGTSDHALGSGVQTIHDADGF